MDSRISTEEKRSRVVGCSNGIADTYWLLRAESEMDQVINLPEFVTAGLLVRYLDELLASMGGAHAVLSPWGADAWGLAKDEFLDYAP
jgi:hypothetical protein